jgi:hypothetical protein
MPKQIQKLKFAEEHIEPILAGRKNMTIRVADRDELPWIGDRVQFCDEDGERFASAIVDDRGWTTVDMVARMDFDGHRNYRDEEDVLDELREYYPDENLDEQSAVELVYWDWEDLWE